MVRSEFQGGYCFQICGFCGVRKMAYRYGHRIYRRRGLLRFVRNELCCVARIEYRGMMFFIVFILVILIRGAYLALHNANQKLDSILSEEL